MLAISAHRLHSPVATVDGPLVLVDDGRIVEILPDGSERTVDHSNPADFVRQVRARCGLTQAAFAEKIEVPIETVRNWEQGKRQPRGPARALLKLIDQAPDVAFATLGRRR